MREETKQQIREFYAKAARFSGAVIAVVAIWFAVLFVWRLVTKEPFGAELLSTVLFGLMAAVLVSARSESPHSKSSQPNGLIKVLLDRNAPFGDRHDAAMDLASFDEPEAWESLTKVKNDPNETPDIVEEAQQSLLEIQRRKSGD